MQFYPGLKVILWPKMVFLISAYIPIQDDIVEGPEQNFTMIDLLLSIWSTHEPGKQIVPNSKKQHKTKCALTNVQQSKQKINL